MQTSTYRHTTSLLKRQTRALRPPIILEIKVLQQIPVLFPCVNLEQASGWSELRPAVLDELEEVSEVEPALEVQQDVVYYTIESVDVID